MIDWISCKIPLGEPHPECSGGFTAIVAADGHIERSYPRPLAVEGSHDSNIRVTTTWHPGRPEHHLEPGSSYLYMTGNPIKWWQGHNLFGTDDLRMLLAVTADRVTNMLDVPVEPRIRRLWYEGWIPLTRVDCTQMYELPSRADVRAFLRHMERSCRSRRNAAVAEGSTVYINHKNRRWVLKAYSKGDELEDKSLKHQLPAGMVNHDLLTGYADKALRVELMMRGLELEKRGLQLSRAWEVRTMTQELENHMELLTMAETFEMPSDVLEKLPRRLVGVYRAYQAGDDLRAFYSKAQFYKVRHELMDLAGVDISVPVPKDDRPSNVISFRRVVEMRPMGIPAWAQGTPLYFEPPFYAIGQEKLF